MNRNKCKICSNDSMFDSKYCLDCIPRIEFMYYGTKQHGNIIMILFLILSLCLMYLSIMAIANGVLILNILGSILLLITIFISIYIIIKINENNG